MKSCKTVYEFEDRYFKPESSNFDNILDIPFQFEMSMEILFKVYIGKNVKIPSVLVGWAEAVENWT